MYRYVRKTPLDTGHQYGDVLKDGDLSETTIKKFLASGTLVLVSSPPLSEIPAFEDRATLLARAGVVRVDDLAEANAAQLAKKVKKSASTIRRWQSEAMQWLAPTENKSTSN